MVRVFVDANVLFSRTKRDWLYAFQEAGADFVLCTSRDVVHELMTRIRDRYPLIPSDKLDYIEKQVYEICTVVDKYDPQTYVDSFVGTDKGDLHVHAAVSAGHCDYLLTDDTQLFAGVSEEVMDLLDYEVTSTDDFFCLLADSTQQFFWRTVQIERHYYNQHNKGSILTPLSDAQCPQFRDKVNQLLKEYAQS